MTKPKRSPDDSGTEPKKRPSGYPDMPWSDEARLQNLIIAAKAGAFDAYEALWTIIAPYVWRLMLVFRRQGPGWPERLDREASERLTNEICSGLWENLNNYQPQEEASFLTWLYSFCRNWKSKLLRPDRPATGKMDELEEKILFKVERPSRHYPTEMREALRPAIRDLDPVEQFVISGRFFDKLSYKTISERLEGNPDKTHYYEVILHRAIKKLKKILVENYGIKRLPEQEDTK